MVWTDLVTHVSAQYDVRVVMADGLTALFMPSPATADPENRRVLVTEAIRRLFARRPAKGLAVVLHEVGHILDADTTVGLMPAYRRLLGRQAVTQEEFDAIWDSELRAWCFAKLQMHGLGYTLSTNLVSLCLASYHLSYQCQVLGASMRASLVDLESLLNDDETSVPSRIWATARTLRTFAWPLTRTMYSSVRYSRATAKVICA